MYVLIQYVPMGSGQTNEDKTTFNLLVHTSSTPLVFIFSQLKLNKQENEHARF